MQRTDGSIYKGAFADDCMTGPGNMRWKDGVEYDGQFKCNKRDGHGRMVWLTGKWKSYDGQWKTNSQHGRGTLTDQEDEEHEGVFENGKLISWEKISEKEAKAEAKAKAKAGSARKAGLQAAARVSDSDLGDVLLFSADEEQDEDNKEPARPTPQLSSEVSADLRLMAL